jgi:hypothetical protein
MGLYVFRIEDSEIHHVIANHPAEAIDVLAKSNDMTRVEYLEEIGDHEVKRLEPFDTVTLRLDDLTVGQIPGAVALGLPKNCAFSVTALCKDWVASDPRPHVLCSSAN